MIPNVIDLSHHNTIPQSLVPAQEAGIYGVIHKATQGTGFFDSKVTARYSLARTAGMAWGIYHYMDTSNVQKQVDWFVSQSEIKGVLDRATLVACDYEESAVSINAVVEFMERLEATVERSPVLYSGHVLKEKLGSKADPRLSKYRLWLAQYGSVAQLPPGWTNYWLWQYTDKGAVPGIDPPTDLNQFWGTRDQLMDQWVGAPPLPPPDVGIIPTKEVTITITVPKGVTVTVNQVIE